MRFGIGWRPELGAGILANLDRIDVVEVLAEEFVHASAPERRALRFLARHVTVVVHGTSLGLASSHRVDAKRLAAVARVVGWIEPELWSEHLAFVRAGGKEIGHLAAPPRSEATLEGLQRNLEIARREVGSLPLLENIATLIEPPFSEWSEPEWIERVARTVDARLLLDLHNLHANATNFGFDPLGYIGRIPRGRVGVIHIAGGKRIEGDRILDDHLHPVPDPVYQLLGAVSREEAIVILERDGKYPRFDELLSEMERARQSVAAMAA